MRVLDLLTHASDVLKKSGVPTAALDARVLVCHALSIAIEDVVANPEKEVDERQAERVMELIERRARREPVSHITGSREFYSEMFKVTSAVLDPRPDSETLIEVVRVAFKDSALPLRILDLGTGSGCLLLTLLKLYPAAKGVGVDISGEALLVAEENANTLGLRERTSFIHGNWTEKVEGVFDIILSNPPYIPDAEIETLEPEVKRYEPRGALSGGADGFDCYRSIVPQAIRRLKPDGFLALECGKGQAEKIKAMLEAEGFERCEIHPDLAGIGRVISGYKAPFHR